MNSDESANRRSYHSPLRAEQAEATRQRVLDALEALAKESDRELSVAAVAKRAGVSLPTIYRHFETRDELLRALVQRFESRLAIELPDAPDEAQLRAAVQAWYQALDAGTTPRPISRLSQLFEISRLHTVPRRRAHFARVLDARAPRLGEPERTRLLDLFVVLCSSATLESFEGYLGRRPAEVGASVDLAIEALLRLAQDLQPPEPR